MYKAVVFDFDGTLCDTGEGIFKSARYALEAFGYDIPEDENLSYFIGPPLLVTFQEHFNTSVTEAEELVKKYRERYTNTGLYECELYEDIVPLLSSLKKDGLKLAIASSKPKLYIDRLLEKFSVTNYFDAVCGVDFNVDCEPKQSIIQRCLAELEVEAEDALVVGDRSYDIDGAAACSADSVGVLWGYGNKFEFIESGATYIAEKAGDVESIALGLYERCEAVNGIYSGRIITVHNDDVLLCDGTASTRECVDHPGGVAVIGLTDDEEILLVRQFRYPYKETIYEIPAGKIEKGEDPFETGKREFKEECGATADNYFFLGEIYPSPGYTNEIIRVWGATGLHFEEQELDEGEFLEAHKMKLSTVTNKIMNGEIKDAKTIIAVLKLKEKLNLR